MPYLRWKRLFSLFGWNVYRCDECGSLHLCRKDIHLLIWGSPCSRHLN